MQYVKWMLVLCLCLQYSSGGNCKTLFGQADAVIDNEYQGDDYDYDDEYDANKSEGSEPKTSKDTSLQPAYFEQSEVELHAKPGDDVLINCDVRHFQIKNVVIWYKDKTVITNGQFAIDHRVEGMKNNSILFKNVQMEDAGDYYCEVLPEKIRLHASLKVGGRLAIFCDGRDITDRSIIFRQGESHTFECKTYMPDELKIMWSFNGQRAENVVTKVDRGQMYIDNIDAEHAGIYQCLGDDGSTEPPHGMVNIDVHYSPKVSTHRHHVNTETAANAELYCDYTANPIAITRWLKDGQVLNYSEKYLIKNTMHKNRNRTVLTVKDIHSADLGVYECQVENTIGSNEIKVFLIFEPETPQFEHMKIDGNKVTLHWLVRSVQPLSEAVLDYKMTGSYTWSTVSVIHTQRHVDFSGMWKVTHEMELIPGDWHTRVKTKNTIGWSKFSTQHDFQIKEEPNDIQMDDEIPPQDMVMAAGIGMGTNKGNSGTHMAATPSAVIASFMFLILFKVRIPSMFRNM